MEVIGATWSRTKVKRRKAFASGKSARGDNAQFLSDMQMYWRRDRAEICWSYPGRSAGFRENGRPYNERRKANGPVDQGSTRSIGRRTKGRPNCGNATGRERVDGEGSGMNFMVLSYQDRIPSGTTIGVAHRPAGVLPFSVASTVGKRMIARSRNAKPVRRCEPHQSCLTQVVQQSCCPNGSEHRRVVNRPAMGFIT